MLKNTFVVCKCTRGRHHKRIFRLFEFVCLYLCLVIRFVYCLVISFNHFARRHCSIFFLHRNSLIAWKSQLYLCKMSRRISNELQMFRLISYTVRFMLFFFFSASFYIYTITNCNWSLEYFACFLFSIHFGINNFVITKLECEQ